MAGFDNDVMYAINADFSNADSGTGASTTGELLTDGQIWIGSTALNAGNTHINVGTLTSPGGTISVGYSSPNITLDVAGGMAPVEHLTGNTGGQLNPDVSNNFNLLTANSTVQFAGSGATLTQDFGLSNILLGVPGSAITTAAENVSLGQNTLGAITSGLRNTAIGKDVLDSVTTASDNTCLGWKAGNKVTGGENTLLGKFSGANIVGGGQNVVIGKDTLALMTSGSSNIIIGRGAGNGYTTTESNNIIIGDSLNGIAGESNVTRIGNTQTKFFAKGIDGVNVGSVATVVTEASDQLGTAVITAGTGITVTPSANAITIAATATGLSILSATVTLTSAQAKALRSTPIQILAGQGAGKLTLVYAFMAEMIYGGTNVFTNTNANMCLSVGTTATNYCILMPSTAFMISSVSAFGMGSNLTSGSSNALSEAAWSNGALYINNNGSADFAGNAANDNTVKCTIFYSVITY